MVYLFLVVWLIVSVIGFPWFLYKYWKMEKENQRLKSTISSLEKRLNRFR